MPIRRFEGLLGGSRIDTTNSCCVFLALGGYDKCYWVISVFIYEILEVFFICAVTDLGIDET